MNQDIRKMIKDSKLYQWQVAKEIGISAGTLTIWLRDEPMDQSRQDRITKAITALSIKKRGEN